MAILSVPTEVAEPPRLLISDTETEPVSEALAVTEPAIDSETDTAPASDTGIFLVIVETSATETAVVSVEAKVAF
jgi:hypothetical protein